MSSARLFENNLEQKYSTQMQAVLLILDADPYLKNTVSPFIDFNTETIHWEPILKMPFGSGHRAAVTWMYGLWTDELHPRSNPFDAALSMDPGLQLAALKALALRWALTKS